MEVYWQTKSCLIVSTSLYCKFQRLCFKPKGAFIYVQILFCKGVLNFQLEHILNSQVMIDNYRSIFPSKKSS